jgi:probable F420-dependent oxidoreductase
VKLDAGIGVEGAQLEGAGEAARAAEALGFAGLWTSETKHDAFLPLALATRATERIELGTAVAIAFSRSPMELAQTAWDLQRLSGGRFILGLGTQVGAHVRRRFSMPWGRPVARLRDYILALREIWHSFQTGEPLDYRGEFYSHTLLPPFFDPGPIGRPRIPVYIAGVNHSLAALAGELCDGLHIHPFHSPEYLRASVASAIAEGAARRGREPGDIERAASVFVITGRDEAEVAAARERRWNEMPRLVTDEMLEAFAVEAEPEGLGGALRERYSGLADRVALYEPFVPGESAGFWRAVLKGIG